MSPPRAPAPPPIARTALFTAWLRERESQRPGALVDDPFAAALLTDEDRRAARELDTLRAGGDAVILRHGWIDVRLFRLVVEEGVRVVVDLGAGLDTRPWRLSWPRELQWVDVDHPGVLAWKRERLAGSAPRCAYEARPGDLLRDEDVAEVAGRASRAARALAAAAPGAPRAPFPVFVLEGVLPYLPEERARRLLDLLRAEAPRCMVIADVVNPFFLRRYAARWNATLEGMGTPLRFATDEPLRFFASEGFSILDGPTLLSIGRETGRWPVPEWVPLPRAVREMCHLVLAQCDPLG